MPHWFTCPSVRLWDDLFFLAPPNGYPQRFFFRPGAVEEKKKKKSMSNKKITNTSLKLRLMSLQSNSSPAVNSPFILLAAVWRELAAQIRSSASSLPTCGASVLGLTCDVKLGFLVWLLVRLKSARRLSPLPTTTAQPMWHLVISGVLTPG